MTDLVSALGDAGSWISAVGDAHSSTGLISIVAALAVAALASSSAPTSGHVPATRTTEGPPMTTTTPPGAIPSRTTGHHHGPMTHHRLRVQGMTCRHCEEVLTHAVGALDGVLDVSVDAATGAIELRCTTLPDLGTVAAAVHDAGYDLVR